jgi:hypothetical protein
MRGVDAGGSNHATRYALLGILLIVVAVVTCQPGWAVSSARVFISTEFDLRC